MSQLLLARRESATDAAGVAQVAAGAAMRAP
jgi:hypothetical protein